MTSLESRRSSFSKILSQDSYLAYVSADLEHDAYLVSGELRNRANEQSVLTGLLEAKHAINKTKMITNVDASGWFQLRLQAGARYHLQFHVDGNHFSLDLDLSQAQADATLASHGKPF